jgi:hypothetical protein
VLGDDSEVDSRRPDRQEGGDDRSRPDRRECTLSPRSLGQPDPNAARGHERERDNSDACERNQNGGRDRACGGTLGFVFLIGGVHSLFLRRPRLPSILLDRLDVLARGLFVVRFGREAETEDRCGHGRGNREKRG